MYESTTFWVLEFGELKFSMVLEFYELEFHKKFSGKFDNYFFKEFEFMELEYYGKFEFLKLKYPKSGRFLHIFKTVVN